MATIKTLLHLQVSWDCEANLHVNTLSILIATVPAGAAGPSAQGRHGSHPAALACSQHRATGAAGRHSRRCLGAAAGGGGRPEARSRNATGSLPKQPGT